MVENKLFESNNVKKKQDIELPSPPFIHNREKSFNSQANRNSNNNVESNLNKPKKSLSRSMSIEKEKRKRENERTLVKTPENITDEKNKVEIKKDEVPSKQISHKPTSSFDISTTKAVKKSLID